MAAAWRAAAILAVTKLIHKIGDLSPIISPSSVAGPLPHGHYPGMGILDEFVMRAALIDARRHVARGLSIDEAVRTSCIGAWRSCRAEVAQRLRAESAEKTRSAESMDEQAA